MVSGRLERQVAFGLVSGLELVDQDDQRVARNVSADIAADLTWRGGPIRIAVVGSSRGVALDFNQGEVAA